MSTLGKKEALKVGLHRRLALHPSLVQLGGLERCASSITIENLYASKNSPTEDCRRSRASEIPCLYSSR